MTGSINQNPGGGFGYGGANRSLHARGLNGTAGFTSEGTQTAIGGRKGSGIDWISIAIFFLLMIAGWFNIYAAVFDETTAGEFTMNSRYGSQLMWMGICIGVAVVIMLIDEIYYHVLAYPAYAAMLLLLLITIIIGTEVNGAKSWIKLGGLSMQPAEFAKFTTALALARFMSAHDFSFGRISNIVIVVMIIITPAVFILLQNDTGSAMVYAAMMLVLYREGLSGWLYTAMGMLIFIFVFSFIVTQTAMLVGIILICSLIAIVMNREWKRGTIYLAGISFFSLAIYFICKWFMPHEISFYWVILGVTALSLIPVGIHAYREKMKSILILIIFFAGSFVVSNGVDYAFDNLLQVHQQKRILNLLGVESDIHKWGYNVNQSKIAIGSGGFLGKGYLQGTQTKYDFVPEQSTDFIFCTVGEEWGFLGAFVVLSLFATLIIRLILMAERQRDVFKRVYCYCVASILLFHVLVNVGMTIGVMPVIGIPLPLFSYGGSSLLAFTILFFIAVKLDSANGDAFKRKI